MLSGEVGHAGLWLQVGSMQFGPGLLKQHHPRFRLVLRRGKKWSARLVARDFVVNNHGFLASVDVEVDEVNARLVQFDFFWCTYPIYVNVAKARINAWIFLCHRWKNCQEVTVSKLSLFDIFIVCTPGKQLVSWFFVKVIIRLRPAWKMKLWNAFPDSFAEAFAAHFLILLIFFVVDWFQLIREVWVFKSSSILGTFVNHHFDKVVVDE